MFDPLLQGGEESLRVGQPPLEEPVREVVLGVDDGQVVLDVGEPREPGPQRAEQRRRTGRPGDPHLELEVTARHLLEEQLVGAHAVGERPGVAHVAAPVGPRVGVRKLGAAGAQVRHRLGQPRQRRQRRCVVGGAGTDGDAGAGGQVGVEQEPVPYAAGGAAVEGRAQDARVVEVERRLERGCGVEATLGEDLEAEPASVGRLVEVVPDLLLGAEERTTGPAPQRQEVVPGVHLPARRVEGVSHDLLTLGVGDVEHRRAERATALAEDEVVPEHRVEDRRRVGVGRVDHLDGVLQRGLPAQCLIVVAENPGVAESRIGLQEQRAAAGPVLDADRVDRLGARIEHRGGCRECRAQRLDRCAPTDR